MRKVQQRSWKVFIVLVILAGLIGSIEWRGLEQCSLEFCGMES